MSGTHQTRPKTPTADFPFDERKATAAAAYLLSLEDGCMKHLRLIKLLYLAERESLRRLGAPICGGRYVSMPHGPVISPVYDLVKADEESRESPWLRQIRVVADHNVELCHAPELGPLSMAEMEILRELSEYFRGKDQWELRDYTHDSIPEWQEVEGTSARIDPDDILDALRLPPDEREHIRQEIRERQHFRRLFTQR